MPATFLYVPDLWEASDFQRTGARLPTYCAVKLPPLCHIIGYLSTSQRLDYDKGVSLHLTCCSGPFLLQWIRLIRSNAAFVICQREHVIKNLTLSGHNRFLGRSHHDYFPGLNLPLCLQWDSESWAAKTVGNGCQALSQLTSHLGLGPRQTFKRVYAFWFLTVFVQ